MKTFLPVLFFFISIAGILARDFTPEDVFNGPKNYAIIVLNRPIYFPAPFMKNLWNNAAVRLTADGGTNNWIKYAQKNNKSDFAPINLVTGDFDSITEESKAKALKGGAQIIHTPDQDATDFTKSLVELAVYAGNNNIRIDTVLVLQQTSGRIDQIIANINTLYFDFIQALYENKNLYLVSDDSLTWLLASGKSTISIPDRLQNKGHVWCSLVPIGEKCGLVSTTGLKYNLNGDSMEFGQIVSTSNTYDGSKVVTVDSSTPLLWSMDITPMFE